MRPSQAPPPLLPPLWPLPPAPPPRPVTSRARGHLLLRGARAGAAGGRRAGGRRAALTCSDGPTRLARGRRWSSRALAWVAGPEVRWCSPPSSVFLSGFLSLVKGLEEEEERGGSLRSPLLPTTTWNSFCSWNARHRTWNTTLECPPSLPSPLPVPNLQGGPQGSSTWRPQAGPGAVSRCKMPGGGGWGWGGGVLVWWSRGGPA